jgi:hypothetical protein
LLDNILLTPGYPLNWSTGGATPTCFGLQDPEFTEYDLSSFSLMCLNNSQGAPVVYQNTCYSNTTTGKGESLLVPYSQALNYTTVATLLGTNGTYGFSFSATPVITVSFNETQQNPLNLSITATGLGSPLAGGSLTYSLIRVNSTGTYPSYTIQNGNLTLNSQGTASQVFNPPINGTTDTYAILVCAQLSGLVGIGYHTHNSYGSCYPIPVVSNISTANVTIAHSRDIISSSSSDTLNYNATFMILEEDLTFGQMLLSNPSGSISPGSPQSLTIFNSTQYSITQSGILVVSYSKNSTASGIVLMPWGVSALAFPVVFGDNPTGKEWVTTDIREVVVDVVTYEATLAMWSIQGYQVIS